MLLVEECFAAEDDRFVAELRAVDRPKLLAAFADRWKQDSRPWARQQMLAYLEQPFDREGHQPVVKRLFKHAEARRDHELMALFLVAFDRQVRRTIVKRWVWKASSRGGIQNEVLFAPRNSLGATSRDPATGRLFPAPPPANPRLFKYRTRYYLRRRAWRYFRKLGFGQPEAYPAAIAQALIAYRDSDFAKGENILDSWGLLHACFGEHDALEFGPVHPRLKANRSFGELASAPAFGSTWKAPAAGAILFSLLFRAQSRLVRVWAKQTFEREHPAYAASVDELLQLLDHDDGDIQQLGARLLANTPGLPTLPVTAWLRLLATHNPEALATLCDLFAKHVSGERLTLAQILELACAQPVPVARLALKFLRERPVTSAADRSAITVVADTRCEALAGELAHWALGHLGGAENYQTDSVSRFFDSLRPGSRDAAWAWLVAEGSPGLADSVLWSRLIETPFDDLRLRLVDHLEREAERRAGLAHDLRAVWTSVLLGVHRGGRQKAKAVRQLGEAIGADPAQAEALLPVLAVAVRSVRRPEARAGLAAVMTLLAQRPELTPAVRRFLPELKWTEVAV
jgi:hypothetical protein